MKRAIAFSLGVAALVVTAGLGLRLAPRPLPMLASDEPLRAYREAVAEEMLAGKPSTRAIRDKLVSSADAQAMMDVEFRLSTDQDKFMSSFDSARLGGLRLDRSHPPALHVIVLMKQPNPEDAQRLADLHLPVPARIEATPFSMAEGQAITHLLNLALDPDFASKARMTNWHFNPHEGRIVVESLSGEARPIEAHLHQFPQLSALPLLVQKGRYAAAA